VNHPAQPSPNLLLVEATVPHGFQQIQYVTIKFMNFPKPGPPPNFAYLQVRNRTLIIALVLSWGILPIIPNQSLSLPLSDHNLPRPLHFLPSHQRDLFKVQISIPLPAHNSPSMPSAFRGMTSAPYLPHHLVGWYCPHSPLPSPFWAPRPIQWVPNLSRIRLNQDR
jgi:hypothetical protein